MATQDDPAGPRQAVDSNDEAIFLGAVQFLVESSERTAVLVLMSCDFRLA